METKSRTIPPDTVDAYNRLYGQETPYPSEAVIDLKDVKDPVNHIPFFDHSQRESLHLSEHERKSFIEYLDRIRPPQYFGR